MRNRETPILILDTSAFLARLPFRLVEPMVTTQAVIEEIKKGRLVESTNTLVQMERVVVQNPQQGSITEVVAKAKKTKDDFVLSAADISLLALALELQEQGKAVVLLTDDYSLQNTAKNLGLPYQKIRTKGIKEQWTWVIICPGCHAEYTTGYRKGDFCPICGTPLIRYHPKTKKESK